MKQVIIKKRQNSDEVGQTIGVHADIIDSFGILDDEKVHQYFELGCELKGRGRGHIKRLKDTCRKEQKSAKTAVSGRIASLAQMSQSETM